MTQYERLLELVKEFQLDQISDCPPISITDPVLTKQLEPITSGNILRLEAVEAYVDFYFTEAGRFITLQITWGRYKLPGSDPEI